VDTGNTPGKLVSARAWVILAYVLALGAAVGAAGLYPGKSRIIAALAGDIAATAVIYVFGRIFRNSSFYDPFWSLAPIAISAYWAFTAGAKPGIEQFIILALVLLWGLRLTWHWARNWRGLGHEDWRYTELRRKSDGWFWLVELAGIDLMPTLVVFLGCLAVYPSLTSRHNFGVMDIIAIVFTCAAVFIESAADEQLEAFIKAPHAEGDVMSSGLWAYLRHPNYLGEIMFWWGLFLFGAVSGAGHWWMAAGPLTVTALFIFISTPMMDRRNFERRPGYRIQTRKLPALLPRFFKS
jgi:steroid 5-alpha reductase family enzyme